MLSKNSILVLFLLLIAMTTLTAVSASDINDDAISEDIGDDSPEEIELDENTEISKKTNTDASDIVLGEDASDDKLKDNEKTFTELQELIYNAEENSTITLKHNYYCDDDFGDEYYGIRINKTLTINGNGHTLNALEKTGVLMIFADDVVINNLTLVGGYDPEKPGSGAYIEGNGVEFYNCEFINNTAGNDDHYTDGGAVFTYGDIAFVGCLFYNNVATGEGGAIYAYNYYTFINDCEFYYNGAYYNGGAVLATSEIYINFTYFKGNVAGLSGGAIYSYYPDDEDISTIITNSYFEENEAYGKDCGGGAVYLDFEREGGFLENGAAKSFIYNTGFRLNQADYGGALFNFQYTDIEDCEFINNAANGGGGAIYMNNGVYNQSNRNTQTFGLEIHGETIFIDNTAKDYGGAIKIYAYDAYKNIKGVLKIYDDVLFEGNNVTGDGKTGDKYGHGGALSIIDSDSSIVGATFRNNNAPKSGGAVEGGSVTNCTFEKNSKPETYGTTVNNGGNNNGNNGNSGTKPDQGTSYNDLLSKVQVTFLPNPVYTTFGSGQNFEVRVIDSRSFTPISGFSVILKVYTGGSFKTITLSTNANGVALFNTAGLSIGTHTVIISNGQPGLFTAADQSSTITITKSSYKINAPKKTFKKTGVYKITVKNSAGKVVKGVKLTVKVYTGKKFKTYNVKTNAKGVASFKVKSLKKGSHKVVITAKATGIYNAAKKTSSIKIK